MFILYSIISILFIIGLGYLLSNNKKKIKIRVIVVGILTQLLIMFFVLRISIGKAILEKTALGVQSVVDYGYQGISFVFGDLAALGVFAINVLAIIIFISALISILQYLGVIPFLVRYLGHGIAYLFGTTQAETFNAVGNIVLGSTEAPLLIRPYLNKLTDSELFTVMVSGMGSASAAILIGYSGLGIKMEYLLIAIFVAPFSSLLMSKLVFPETKESLTKDIVIEKSSAINIFEAIGDGTYNGLMLALNIGAMLIAFVGLVELINGIISIFNTNLSEVLGYIFYPLGFIYGIPKDEIMTFSSSIGTKFAVNEFVAFINLQPNLNGLSERTIAILSVSLCNFANFSSIGILIGGFNAIAHERKSDVAKFGFKALLTATLSTLLSGALIGLFI